MREAGRECQAEWGCPFAKSGRPRGFTLPPERVETIKAVERFIGAELPHDTCPFAHARLPWVHEALQARKWLERGMLEKRVGEPLLVLLEAIDEIDAGLAARESCEIEAAREEAERRREEWERTMRNHSDDGR